ncbi:glycoside hydrolase family 20 zincin-like fold domain-containing protein, partial [Actinoplanes sp. NPDC051633]|uniref:glycoside hydrolase family 20 zincin-like fold domain-containing protein n=1 Tax=Actinoplanes sp. NPDC051633 TaxID=3155670 RepID=UPI00343F612B
MPFSPILAAATLLLPVAPAAASTALDRVIPAPAQVSSTGRDFHLSRQTVIETRVRDVGALLSDDLRAATGLTLPVRPTAAPAAPKIGLRLKAGLGEEGYRLTVDRTSVEVTASTPAGLFAGTQTLLQART